jgi:hypothetical protein
VERQIERSSAKGSSSKLSYVVDSHREDVNGSCQSVMNKLTTTSPKSLIWDGISGQQHHAPVIGEWQRLISNNQSSFMYFGFERFAARFPAHHIAALNLSQLNLVILADRATNEVSHRRQSKLDNQKR